LNPRAHFETGQGVSTLLCYVSGHGFGHAVRVMEVITALWARRPDLNIAIRTPAPRWIFEFNLHRPFTLEPCRLDVGAVQADSLSIDIEATLQAYAAITARQQKLIAAEVAAVAPLRPTLILSDIPALAFDVGERLGVPGIAMTNFSWDWIYADYVQDLPRYAHLVAELRASYAKAALLLRLPLYGDLAAFSRICDVPLVARTATRLRDDVRRALGLPQNQRVVLLSFGGIGITLRTPPTAPPDVTFVVTDSAAPGGTAPPRCRLISTAELTAANVRHEDLLAACDAVMTKPGYGIVAECIANATPIVYTSRGRFAEYACLVRGIEAYLPNAFISNDDLHAGRWTSALDAVFAQPKRDVRIEVNGSAVAADILNGLLEG
jgi:hypothetical protein